MIFHTFLFLGVGHSGSEILAIFSLKAVQENNLKKQADCLNIFATLIRTLNASSVIVYQSLDYAMLIKQLKSNKSTLISASEVPN